jgi:hypothetical protein
VKNERRKFGAAVIVPGEKFSKGVRIPLTRALEELRITRGMLIRNVHVLSFVHKYGGPLPPARVASSYSERRRH